MFDARGQSEVVGVPLLIGVVVILVTIVGAFVLFGDGGPAAGTDDPLADVAIEATEDRLTLSHEGGDPLEASAVRVFLRGNGTDRQFTISTANLSGGDATFGPGDTVEREHGVTGQTLSVVVVHVPTNTVLAEETIDLQQPGGERVSPFVLVWETASDWNAAGRSDGSLVHATAGDHRGDEVSLGHPPTDAGLVAYWPFDEGAGASVATDASPAGNDGTVVATSAGTTGVFGTDGYEFDGSGAVVNVSDSATLDSIADRDAVTFSGWVHTTDRSRDASLFSQYDGLDASSDDDIVVGLREGAPGVFFDDEALSEQWTLGNASQWEEGTFTDTALDDGNLTLRRTQGVAHGHLAAPTTPSSQSVSVGFEPDLIVFRTVVTGRSFDETADVGGQQFGSGHGFADCTTSGCQERGQSTGTGSSSPNGRSAAASGVYSVFQVVPANVDGTGDGATVKGTVSSTDADGFTLTFDEVAASGPRVQIQYSAYAFPDGTEVDVGSFRTPDAAGSNPTGRQHVETGFEPNYVHVATGPSVQQLGDEETDVRTEWGWSLGWAINNESRTLSTTRTVVGETGTVTVADGNWRTIQFNRSYANPVVVGTVNSENDGEHALTFDARNVGSNSAEVRVCESEADAGDGCDTHGDERVGYVVIDAAKTDEVAGLDAGTRTIDSEIDARRDTISFSESYGSAPVVLANVQTTNGQQPVETRVTDTSAADFTVGICHQDGVDDCNASHVGETVGWVSLPAGSLPFDQPGEVGQTGTSVRNSDWTSQSFTAGFASAPAVVVETQTENGGQEVQIDEARSVTAGGADVRYCELPDPGGDPDGCDTHTDENVGWLAVEPGTNLTVTTVKRRTQVVLSQSAYADDINYHLYAANDSELIHTLFANKSAGSESAAVTGRVRAYLEGYNDTGFTLEYAENDPDGDEGDRFLATYVAVRLPGGHPELGYATTPTTTGTQTLSTARTVTDLSLTASSAIPGVDVEGWSGLNEPDNHLGWTYGAGTVDVTDGVAVGYGSHSNSVNAHATGSRADPFYLLYADRNGGVLGRAEASIDGVSDAGVTLAWENVTTTATTNVAHDSVLYVYRSFGITDEYASSGSWESATFDAGKPVDWGGTSVEDVVPSGTSVDVDYSDGSTWYETIDAVPRSRTLQYDVTLSGDGSSRPTVEWVNATYRAQAFNRTWTTDTAADFAGGTTDDTTVSGDGNVTLGGSPPLGEAGTVTVSDGGWETITFANSYENPVVVGTVNDDPGSEPALTFDARNVDATSAEVRVCETRGSTDGCDAHGAVTVGYLVINGSAASSVDGIESGTFEIGGRFDDSSQSVSYVESFGSGPEPVVLANVQNDTGAQPVEARVTDARDTGFTAGICHQDGVDDCDAGHATLSVGWVALEPGNLPFAGEAAVGTTGTTVANSQWESQSFGPFEATPVVVAETQSENGPEDVQVDEARRVSRSGAEVRYCEIEGNRPDTCDTHTYENVGWVAVTPGPLVETYAGSGEYRSGTFDAGRRVNWTGVTVDAATPSGTTIDVDYSDGSTWYEDLSAVPASRTLQYNATLSTTTDATPLLDGVSVDYEESGWYTTRETVADGDWHHVAATYDGSDLALYVDGHHERTVTVGATLDPADVRRQLGGERTGTRYFDGRLDAPRLYNRTLSADEVRTLYNATTNGTLVTHRRSFRTAIEPSNLRVRNVSASVPAGTTLTVVVESDPDDDGDFERESDPISLDGTGGPYGVDGIDDASRFYRLRVTFETTDPTATPTLDEIELHGDV